MSLAFEPITICNKTLQNRFIRSSTHEGLSDKDGRPTQALLDLLVNLSKGKVGMIIGGFAYVNKNGRAYDNQTGLYSDEIMEDWKPAIEQIHANGSIFLFQLTHGGSRVEEGLEKVTPSNVRGRELTAPEIKAVISDFVAAAVRCKNVGADGIQFSAGHGYLLSTFLSPITNKRTDEYGGSDENRVRIVAEITEGIKKECGEDFIVGAKINGDDYIDGGVNKEIASKHVSLLKDKIDFFEISCGLGVPNTTIHNDDPDNEEAKAAKAYEERRRMPRGEGYNSEIAAFIKQENPDALVSSVGGIRSKEFIESLLRSKKADLISLARPFLNNPNFLETLK
ncbi:oxidoreductase, FAD/FMN-binding family protein [Tritrichomonas foetus]|uniref:Oxidoreductase, FAD/FMN-binding family protein n=1 Tax=Tritrichomonas foetus TaxID=1144522 RepID=A0A1J4KWE4_9EUKA|nr:oxidoreductase, FAD/FMN-binding family protein [Tritrichomonas foetus]|eukprot:OHT15601.1 oxidoreductase, FAD/FMN-binding family protein [Tritrichomonas foetus]